MKIRLMLLLSCAAFLVSCKPPKTPSFKPTLSSEPLGADNLAIYRDVLTENSERLRISAVTVPFRPTDDEKKCLPHIRSADLEANVIHLLTADDFPHDKLVKPEETTPASGGIFPEETGYWGAFTFSEIAFDRSHTHAALSYSSYWDRMHAFGATVTYEKEGGIWKPVIPGCGTTWTKDIDPLPPPRHEPS